jgi:hypothetical protein
MHVTLDDSYLEGPPLNGGAQTYLSSSKPSLRGTWMRWCTGCMRRPFRKVDCLECANCCKTTGPLWTDRDRERVAKHLGMKTAAFEAQYLRVDEDQGLGPADSCRAPSWGRTTIVQHL